MNRYTTARTRHCMGHRIEVIYDAQKSVLYAKIYDRAGLVLTPAEAPSDVLAFASNQVNLEWMKRFRSHPTE
jgi:uncharacterized protein YjhX (UPF0386 family)